MNTRHCSRSYLLGAAIAMALPLVAVAQPQEVAHSSTVTSTAHEMARSEDTLKATVVKVDHDTRMITLRSADGEEATIEAGPDVKNLDQLKAGDLVTAHYQRALALELLPAGSASTGVAVEGGVVGAPKGQKPGMTAGHSVTIVAKLAAVDMKNHTVTLQGDNGEKHVIEVKDPARQARMSQLKVGDMVRITYVEAVVVTVTPQGKAKG
ncbi:hypothetical protein ISN76_16595 [Dyella halodurans]|uniref:DUF5666 domain-containing protein n=1 Tax=Dyella halodurans TaxID=1920171 RepID=A0ABV9C7B2_9GAMM|nr:hypothetical protein [Dyella halodurans]